MDVAQLGLEVQSGSVKAATNDLNKLTNAAKVAEQAVAGLSSQQNAARAALSAAKGYQSQSAAALAAARASNSASDQDLKAAQAALQKAKAVTAAARADLDSVNASLAAAKANQQQASASLRAAQIANTAAATGNAQARAIAQTAGQAQQQVRNLAFQFQDIATMMAMGQSPLMLLAQQLPQVTMYGGRLTGVMTALRSTIASFISPLGLITTGFVLLGSAAISYFSELWNRGSESEEVLQKQEALVARVAERWGEAYPAIKKYNDEIKRTREQAELLSAVEIVKTDKLKNAGELIEKIRIDTTDFVSGLSQRGEAPEVISAYQRAIEAAIVKIREGSDASGELANATKILSSDIEDRANPAVVSMISWLEQLAGTARKTAGEIASVVNTAAALQSELQDTIQAATFRDNGGAVRSTNSFVPRIPATPQRRPLIELEGMDWIKTPRAKKDSSYDSATRSVAEQTRALQAQTTAQSSLNPLVNDYGYAVAKSKVETDLLLAAEKDKKALTPQLIAQIGAQSEAYAQAVVEQNRLTEATRKAQEAMSFVKNTALGFVNDLRNGLKNGEGFWKSFGNAALNVLDRITDKLLGDVMDALFQVNGAGGGGGLLSGLFGRLFGGGGFKANTTLGGFLMNGYADGTASARAGLAMVGEEGPELVRFKGGEKVIPNHQLRGVNDNGGSGQGISVSAPVEINIDATGADPAGLARVERQLASLKAELPNQIVSTVQNAQKRRGL